MSKNSTNDELIEKIVHLMRTDDATDAPADAVKWAKNIFRMRGAQKQKPLIQKVLAVLQADLSGGQAAFGERSAASQARQMFFRAGENAIDLRIIKTESGINLQGQILGAGFAGCVVKLGELETTANRLCEFSFSGIPSGKYDLILLADDKEITASNLELN